MGEDLPLSGHGFLVNTAGHHGGYPHCSFCCVLSISTHSPDQCNLAGSLPCHDRENIQSIHFFFTLPLFHVSGKQEMCQENSPLTPRF